MSKSFFKKMSIYIFLFFATFSFIYTPVIISDIMKKGENSKNFVQALSSKPTNKPLLDKVLKNLEENIKYYCLITTASCLSGDAQDSPFSAGFTLFLFISGIVLAIRAIKKEQNRTRKDFLLLLFVWMGVFFILTTPVSFQLRPRFFILVFAIPFILMGIIFDFLQKKWPKKSTYIIITIFVIILGLNVFGILAWFDEQKKSQLENAKIERTLILKNKDGVTRGELQRVVDFMYAKKQFGNTIYFYVKPEHVQPVRYLLNQKNDVTLDFATLNIIPSSDPKAQFFAIIPSESDINSLEKKFEGNFKVVASMPAGQISVYEIFFPNRIIDADFKEKVKNGLNDRLFWKDVFGIQEKNSEQVNKNEEENEEDD